MNAIHFYLAAKNLEHGMMEGEVVDGISAVEQRAVNIEEIGVCRAPAEPWAYIGAGSGCWLAVRS